MKQHSGMTNAAALYKVATWLCTASKKELDTINPPPKKILCISAKLFKNFYRTLPADI